MGPRTQRPAGASEASRVGPARVLTRTRRQSTGHRELPAGYESFDRFRAKRGGLGGRTMPAALSLCRSFVEGGDEFVEFAGEGFEALAAVATFDIRFGVL